MFFLHVKSRQTIIITNMGHLKETINSSKVPITSRMGSNLFTELPSYKEVVPRKIGLYYWYTFITFSSV